MPIGMGWGFLGRNQIFGSKPLKIPRFFRSTATGYFYLANRSFVAPREEEEEGGGSFRGMGWRVHQVRIYIVRALLSAGQRGYSDGTNGDSKAFLSPNPATPVK